MHFEKDKATICIVNYKTERLTRLCLRSIRKFTKYPYKVIVVDNGSNDSSLDYLRTLKWIHLIERKNEAKVGGSRAHGSGLDVGLEQCDTQFFIAMHSDIVIRQENWLTELANFANTDEQIACVGAGKIETINPYYAFIKKWTNVKRLIRKISGNDRDRFYISPFFAGKTG